MPTIYSVRIDTVTAEDLAQHLDGLLAELRHSLASGGAGVDREAEAVLCELEELPARLLAEDAEWEPPELSDEQPQPPPARVAANEKLRGPLVDVENMRGFGDIGVRAREARLELDRQQEEGN
jgi:hypothetical protein